MTSREGKPITTMGHIRELLEGLLREDGAALDGELWVPGTPFQTIASAIKREQELSQKIQYHVYDAPIARPFRDRTLFVQCTVEALPADAAIKFVETHPIANPEQLMAFQQSCLADGYEGAMLRYGLDNYEAGKRSASLLKVKTFHDEEFRVVGCKEGRATYEGMAIFECITATGAKFDVTAPGTLEEKRQFWADRAKYLDKLLTVKYFEFTTTESPVPRFPVAVRFRAE